MVEPARTTGPAPLLNVLIADSRNARGKAAGQVRADQGRHVHYPLPYIPTYQHPPIHHVPEIGNYFKNMRQHPSKIGQVNHRAGSKF